MRCTTLQEIWFRKKQISPPLRFMPSGRRMYTSRPLSSELVYLAERTFSVPCTVDSPTVAPARSKTVTSSVASPRRRRASSTETTTTIVGDQVLPDIFATNTLYYSSVSMLCSKSWNTQNVNTVMTGPFSYISIFAKESPIRVYRKIMFNSVCSNYTTCFNNGAR